MNRHELDAARRRTLQQDALAGLPLRALDIAALMTLPEPTIDWVWDGYIETATVAQLHGNGGAGKSILAMALVRAAAGGYDLLGRRTFPARAVIVDGENPTPELHRRLHRLDYAAISDMVSYQQVDDAIFADLAKSELALCELAESARSDLMVLDSQRALWPGDENEAQGVRPFYMMLRRVANQTSTAVLVVHHDNKNGGYSGSSDLNAGVDSRLHLIRDDDGRIELRHEKLRCDVEQPTVRYRLGVEDGRYAFTMDEVRTARSDVLSALTSEWQIATEIAKVAGVRRDQAEQVLDVLARSGDAETLVGPPGRSPRARCWRLPVRTWDRSGQVAQGDPCDHLSHEPHTPVGGGFGTGQGRVPVPASDRYFDADDVRHPE